MTLLWSCRCLSLWGGTLCVWVALAMLLPGVGGTRTVVRDTRYGKVRGTMATLPGGHRLEKFLGIPYARPPLARLRFEAPEPPEPWAPRVLHATELPPACLQPRVGLTFIQSYLPSFNRTSEDCLYLNIFVPQPAYHVGQRKHAVLVFVHGGSYQNGMGAMLEGSFLTSKDLIVVTFNYRLGPLGFLSGADMDFPGNYGLLDQVAALRWIQENIEQFGGDPSRVTIDGHSAGGCSVGILMLSPLAKGLFHGVIQQSGSPLANWAVTRHQRGPSFSFKLFVSALGCSYNSSLAIKRCLQQLPSRDVEALILEETEVPLGLVPLYRPVVDGLLLPDTPERLMVSGEVNAPYYMTGATKDEGLMVAVPLLSLFAIGHHGVQKMLAFLNRLKGDLPEVIGIVDAVMDQYTTWPVRTGDHDLRERFSEILGDYFIVAPTYKTASLLSRRNVTVFTYNYEYQSVFDQLEGDIKGVIHGAELFYLSGYPLIGHPNSRYTEADKRMAFMLLQLWSNFVKNGLPTLVPEREFHMTPYTDARPAYTRIFSRQGYPEISAETHFKPDKMSFWNHEVPNLYRQQLKRDNNVINVSDTPVRRNGTYVINHFSNSWILIAACIGLSVLTVLLSVCYCQMRRQVSLLIRQSSVSSGERML